MNGSKIRVGQVKVLPERGSLKVNHRVLMDVLAEIEKREAPDVVVTPQGFLDGYVSKSENVMAGDMIRYAIDPNTSPYVEAASEWSRRNRSWLIYGCIRRAGNSVFNTALILNREGKLVGCYDKLHLQEHDQKYSPGNCLDVYDSDFGLFGVMICADRRWPETVRTLGLQGARVIFNPTYGMHNDLNLCMMRTRAYESELFIVFTHPEQALITDPEGRVVLNDEDRLHRCQVSEIDLAEADARRASSCGHLRDRRQDVYRL